ncbi:unnamed protein product [Cyberlindnera jadinii]|uniref:Uncharacterized protein n=1 Tax=Cyberlindnera jadinii (strain ATCC 18201 / CBS 1600 / BCRC 20928 / JCM 3617 / NBRC 0987 / NRRL Y-1542) TaxID=983966 RepID=A0A0H5C6E8_CYBJN|nr:unnamed protein product [Cyberlindnera jadinii]
MPSSSEMIPTFRGYIGSTKDALLVIQGVLSGQLSAVPRRPHDGERIDLIASGNVFVFIEERSGIKRWTDGVAWSPSRILGRFLVYRELDRQALTNSKEKGSRLTEKAKRKRKSSGDLIKDSMGNGSTPSTVSGSSSGVLLDGDAQRQPNRQLVGSLIASYAFKESGLIKKTMSVTVNRVDSNQRPSSEIIHLVSYYCADDVLNGVLVRPSDSPQLKDLQLAPELWAAVKDSSLGGKIPIEDEAYYLMDSNNSVALGFNTQMFQGQPGQMIMPQSQGHLPVGAPPPGMNAGLQGPAMYGVPTYPYQPNAGMPPYSSQGQPQGHAMSFSLPPPLNHGHGHSSSIGSTSEYANEMNVGGNQGSYQQRLSQQYVPYVPLQGPTGQQQQQQMSLPQQGIQGQQQQQPLPDSPTKREFVPASSQNYFPAGVAGSSQVPRQGDLNPGANNITNIPPNMTGSQPVPGGQPNKWPTSYEETGGYYQFQQPH